MVKPVTSHHAPRPSPEPSPARRTAVTLVPIILSFLNTDYTIILILIAAVCACGSPTWSPRSTPRLVLVALPRHCRLGKRTCLPLAVIINLNETTRRGGLLKRRCEIALRGEARPWGLVDRDKWSSSAFGVRSPVSLVPVSTLLRERKYTPWIHLHI